MCAIILFTKRNRNNRASHELPIKGGNRASVNCKSSSGSICDATPDAPRRVCPVTSPRALSFFTTTTPSLIAWPSMPSLMAPGEAAIVQIKPRLFNVYPCSLSMSCRVPSQAPGPGAKYGTDVAIIVQHFDIVYVNEYVRPPSTNDGARMSGSWHERMNAVYSSLTGGTTNTLGPWTGSEKE